jgi:hypothetical protein
MMSGLSNFGPGTMKRVAAHGRSSGAARPVAVVILYGGDDLVLINRP